MKIPDKVKITNYTYSVINTDEPLLLDHRECKGMIDYEEHTISLKNMGDTQGKEQTLLHEILHAIEYDRDLDLGTQREVVIDAFAVGLHQLILDNPQIFENV